jgi:hypothetical protein
MAANDFVLRRAHDPGLAETRDSTAEVALTHPSARPWPRRRSPSGHITGRIRPAADRKPKPYQPFVSNPAARHLPARVKPMEWP